MDDSHFTITFPFDARTGWVLTFVIAMVLGSTAIFAVLKFGDQKSRLGDWQKTTIETLTVIFTPIWIMLVGLVLWSLIKLAAHFPSVTGDGGDTLRWHVLALVGLLTALGGLLSTPLALIRVYTTERQTRTAEQSHITDQISKAVEQLGTDKTVTNDSGPQTKPNIEVRVGGLLALERVKNSHPSEHLLVMEILCTYIRQNIEMSSTDLPAPPLCDVLEYDVSFNPVSTDIKTAFDIIARRSSAQRQIEAEEKLRGRASHADLSYLKFSGLDLNGIDFCDFDLSNCLFIGCRLENNFFIESSLVGAVFRSSHLGSIEFRDAEMRHSKFYECLIKYTKFPDAGIWSPKLFRCKLVDVPHNDDGMLGAHCFNVLFEDSDLSGSEIVQDRLNGSFAGPDVKIPNHCTRPKHWPTTREYWILDKEYLNWLEERDSYIPPQDRA